MGIRTVCFIAAVLVGPNWFRWVLITAALFLPYVAVVMANAVHSRDDRFALLAEGGLKTELTTGHKTEDTP